MHKVHPKQLQCRSGGHRKPKTHLVYHSAAQHSHFLSEAVYFLDKYQCQCCHMRTGQFPLSFRWQSRQEKVKEGNPVVMHLGERTPQAWTLLWLFAYGVNFPVTSFMERQRHRVEWSTESNATFGPKGQILGLWELCLCPEFCRKINIWLLLSSPFVKLPWFSRTHLSQAVENQERIMCAISLDALLTKPIPLWVVRGPCTLEIGILAGAHQSLGIHWNARSKCLHFSLFFYCFDLWWL